LRLSQQADTSVSQRRCTARALPSSFVCTPRTRAAPRHGTWWWRRDGSPDATEHGAHPTSHERRGVRRAARAWRAVSEIERARGAQTAASSQHLAWLHVRESLACLLIMIRVTVLGLWAWQLGLGLGGVAVRHGIHACTPVAIAFFDGHGATCHGGHTRRSWTSRPRTTALARDVGSLDGTGPNR